MVARGVGPIVNSWTPGTLRVFEEDIKECFLRGEIHAPIHLSGGNEEQLIQIFNEVQPEDWVCSTHRSHYHALLKGVPEEQVKAETLANRSIHLNFKGYNFISSAIVAGCLPIALGLALAIKRKGENRKVWCFIGDMAAQTGLCYEVVKYARNFGLPLQVVVEDNGLSTNTPTYTTWGMGELRFEGVRTLQVWEGGKVMHYLSTRVYPHIGVGKFVIFS